MKIDCAACGPELASYAAGDGDPGTRSAVATHLAACPDCRRELERENEMRTALAGLPLVTCPAAVTGRVLETIARQRAGARQRLWFAGAGATLAAAALAGALLLRPGTAPTPGAETGSTGQAAATTTYTAEEIATARRELIQTVTLTARVLDQAGRRTLADVFSERLPAAVAGSLRPLDDPTRGG